MSDTPIRRRTVSDRLQVLAIAETPTGKHAVRLRTKDEHRAPRVIARVKAGTAR